MSASKRKVIDHHEQTRSVQNAFSQNVSAFVLAFQELENPFDDDGGLLFMCLTCTLNLILKRSIVFKVLKWPT